MTLILPIEGSWVVKRGRPAIGRRAGSARPRADMSLRNAAMKEMFLRGKTLAEVGAAFGITRERVRQVLTKVGITRLDGGAAMRSLRNIRDKAEKIDRLRAKREQRHFDKYGMSIADLDAICAAPRSSREHPTVKFSQQKKSAKARGIAWELSFADWWRIWRESGKWDQRGRSKGYCMARWGDDGPYSAENVYICTIGQNFSDSYSVKPWASRFPNGHPASALRRGTGRGWYLKTTRKTKRYVAQICVNGVTVYIGSFKTPEQAHAAYLAKASEAWPA